MIGAGSAARAVTVAEKLYPRQAIATLASRRVCRRSSSRRTPHGRRGGPLRCPRRPSPAMTRRGTQALYYLTSEPCFRDPGSLGRWNFAAVRTGRHCGIIKKARSPLPSLVSISPATQSTPSFALAPSMRPRRLFSPNLVRYITPRELQCLAVRSPS